MQKTRDYLKYSKHGPGIARAKEIWPHLRQDFLEDLRMLRQDWKEREEKRKQRMKKRNDNSLPVTYGGVFRRIFAVIFLLWLGLMCYGITMSPY